MKVRLTYGRLAVLKTLVILALPLAGEFGFLASFGLLALLILRGPVQTVEALSLTVVLGVLTPGLYSTFPEATMVRWGMLMLAFVATLVRYRPKRVGLPAPVFWLGLFTAAAVVLALSSSYYPDASLSKLGTFFIGGVTALMSAQLCRDKLDRLREWFLYSFATIIVISAPLMFNGLGYLRNGRGFQGLMAQPQAYAVVLAPYVAWIVSLIMTRRLRSKAWWGVAAVAAISLVQTEARTGMLAAMAGIGVAFMLNMMNQRARRGRGLSPTLFLALGGILVGLAVVAVFYDRIALAIQAFLLKDDAMDLQGAFMVSRGGLIELSWANFLLHPMTGIGFGLPSDPSKLVLTYIGPIPFSASAEKGFLVFALLEELGLIGAIFFAPLLIALFAPAFRRLNAAAAAFAVAAFATNFGESTFYSMGGLGLLLWLFMSFGYAEAAATRPIPLRRRAAQPRPGLPPGARTWVRNPQHTANTPASPSVRRG